MRRLVVGWVAALMLLSLSAPALAHAVLVESAPEDGARLDSPPAEAMLRFNEPVRPVSVTLIGPGGVTLPLPAPAAGDGALRVALPGGLAVGTHILSYRVSSADGHPVAGSLLFGIGAEPERPAELGGATPPATLLAAAAVRALHYGSLLAAVGGGLFLVLVAGRWSPLNRRLRPGLCLGVGVAALVAVLNAGLAGAVLEGAPLSALASAPPWIAGLTSTAGAGAPPALRSAGGGALRGPGGCTRPGRRLQGATRRLARDPRDGQVTDLERRDELGDMARAVHHFAAEI
ncbi:hypothetical protein GBZ26_27140, partial [Azospirillum formosense]